MKRTYVNRLPKNEEVKNTNVKVENGQIFVEVEFEEKFQPKDGDFCATDNGCIFIYNSNYKLRSNYLLGYYVGIDCYNDITINEDNRYGFSNEVRHATPEEKAAFLERLEKECHKRWNEEKKCLEDIYIPKFGDIVKVICSEKGTKRDYMICIVPEHDYDVYNIANIDKGGALSYVCGRINQLEIKPATKSERQELFDKLAEVGKKWNPETKELEDIRWRAKKGGKYYRVTTSGVFEVEECEETCSAISFFDYSCGNYFRLREAAKKVADQIKEIFKKSKAE